ncbi:hypothetical protein BDP27DRAFT_1323050 [Rhodocollybia butyracea]|uniref:Ankyrin repeat protein n=1 Tax=Rhodocollybia butyracea TaxID=206335 RepID=A0A9P5UA94_9AGAR|nr:hypothetical protein BDP27DRAFT_1323050 [Rhodocollybia butyracea]
MPVPLRANASLRAEAKYNVVTEFPNYELHSAAANGNQGLVEYALNRGQPVNSVLDGVLPLHAACAGGHEQVVKLLIDHGADVNAARLPRRFSNEKNRDASAPIVGTTGSTPLHFAAARGNKNVIVTLLLRGAHADRRDKHGMTPVMLAEQYGWLECVEVLNNWVKDKDRDLRERSQLDEGASTSASTAVYASTGNEDDVRPSTRNMKHVQVKRSIDTALNMFKSGSSSTPQSKLAINSTSSTNNLTTFSPSTSPTRTRHDFSSSPSVDGRRFSRPSLPHIFQTTSSSPQISQRAQKPATLTKTRSPRRPRSAGTDAEREPEVDNHGAVGQPGSAKKLGTKYSLLNLFKKGNETGGVPLERTTSHQIGYRFGVARSPSHTRTSPSTPYYTSRPLAVDLHNAIAAHQRIPNRSRSSEAVEPPMGLGISFDEGDSDISQSSNSSNRNAAIFDDTVIIAGAPTNGSSGMSSSRNNSRPSILRGHNRTSSSGQQRALRFDSSASGTSLMVTIPLRGCISAGSLNRFRDERNGSPRLQPMALDGEDSRQWIDRVPESAPPNIGDFEVKAAEEPEYGQPIPSLTVKPRLDIQTRNGESSLSPALSPDEGSTATSALNTEFPFSINAPPPMDDPDNVVAVQLQVYPPQISPVDSRLRGNSVSSTSTADSGLNPSFECQYNQWKWYKWCNTDAYGLPNGGSYLNLPEFSRSRNHREKVSVTEMLQDDYRDGLEAGSAHGIAVVGINERRSHTALKLLDVDLISSHAQAEALVQRTQQDILSAHAVGQNSSISDSMPLSARLAALGESLELERRLREQKQLEERKVREASVDLSEDTSSTTRTEVLRQSSLDDLTGSIPVSTAIRRPHANSEASRIGGSTGPDISSLERTKPTHQPSLSASLVETASPAFDSDAESPAIQSKFFDRRPRSRTPDPDNDLSRISSLEAFDADTELGPSLYRVSTAPNSGHSARDKREREFASNTKLARMGFSPNEIGRAPPKRFGLKSLMQSLKGSK